MATTLDIRVPKVGLDTTEVVIAGWRVQNGDAVQVGSPLAELESEKVIFTLESEAAGRLIEILHPEGSIVAVGAIICRLTTD